MLKLLTFLLLLIYSCWASSLDLLQTYQAAKQHDKQYLLAQTRFKAQVLNKNIARARSLPQLSYNYRWMQNDYRSDQQSVRFPNTFEDQLLGCGQANDVLGCLVDGLTGVEIYNLRSKYTSSESNITLSQVIFDPEVNAERAIGRAHALKAAAELSLAEKQLILRVLNAYLAGLHAEQQQQWQQQLLALQQSQYDYSQSRAEQGLLDHELVIELGLAKDEQAMRLASSKAERHLAVQTLEQMTGQTALSLVSFSPKLSLAALEQHTLEYWQRIAVEFNDSLKVAEAAELIGQAELRKHRLNRLPRVTVAANYQDRKLRGGQAFQPASHSTAYGVDVRLPLFHGGALYYGKKQAAYQLMEAQDNLAWQQEQLNTSIASAYFALENLDQYLLNKQKALRSQEQLLAVTRASYENGSKPFEAVAQAKQKTVLVQAELLDAQHRLLRQWFELKLLAGTLSLQDVEQLNHWLLVD